MTFVVTGGAGFIGSALVASLNSRGIDDIIIVDRPGSSPKWKNLQGKRFRDYIDKEDFLGLLEADSLRSLKAIFHLGASSATTVMDGDFLLRNNFEYTKRLAQFCVPNNIRFIYASSAATYGAGEFGYEDSETDLHKFKPLNPYGFSKQLFDMWALFNRYGNQRYLDKIAGLKFFNVFGPNEYHKGDQVSVVFKAYHQIKDKGEVSLFKSYRPEYQDGAQMRDFVYVKDCVDVMLWLAENPNVNGIYNVGAGEARTWNDLVKAIFVALNLPIQINYIDMPEQLRNQYQYFTKADISKLKAAGCPITPRRLEDGVTEYVQDYLEKGLEVF